MNSIAIRKATKNDLRDLLHVARTAFLQAFTVGNEPQNVSAYLDQAFTVEQFGKEMANPASSFFLAELSGELVGYVKVNEAQAQTDLRDPRSLEIARLYVLEDYLGLGVGKVLLDYSIDLAKRSQKKYLWLGVWERNARAIRFYEKNGLRVFGSHPFQFGEEIQSDYLMRVDF